ncbi:putative holin-like toxin [Sporosarcina sp. YIM B06819]|nr:putative holin-like toxin [Sporosarcina sp. YIM B06819]
MTIFETLMVMISFSTLQVATLALAYSMSQKK